MCTDPPPTTPTHPHTGIMKAPVAVTGKGKVLLSIARMPSVKGFAIWTSVLYAGSNQTIAKQFLEESTLSRMLSPSLLYTGGGVVAIAKIIL